MSDSMGVIYYEVDVDTGKLVNSTGTMDKSLDGLQKEFDKTDRQAGKFNGQMNKVAEGVKRANAETQGATNSLNGLYKILAGLVSLRAANYLIEMAESYNTYAERVRMATQSQSEFEMVQRRLLDTANGTYRALSEAQEVYIRTADGLRDMGYSTEQALDITDSLSYAFVKNEASIDRANNAINAYSKAINKGRVDAEAWESIIAAVPTVINDIAEASGRSAQEVRRLGAEGKITARDLNEGLRQSLEANRDAADGMATTVKDALTNLKNNLSAYLGEANQATGATSALSSTIVALGDNIDTLVNLLVAAGAGALANFIARTGMAAIESAKAAMAARAQAVEELKLAQAHAQVTAQALRHAQANAGLMGTVGALTAAENAHSQALMRVASAQRAVTTVGGSLLRILGGPIGLISLAVSAATGMYMFRDSNNDARQSILDLNQPMDTLVKQFRELGDAQRELALIQWSQQLVKSSEDAGQSLFDLNQNLSRFGGRAVYEFQKARQAGQDLLPVLDSLIERGIIPESDRAEFVSLIANYQKASSAVSQYEEKIVSLRQENKKLGESRPNISPPEQNDSEAQKRIDRMRQEIELIKLIGVERAKLSAIQEAGAGASKDQIKDIRELADELYRLKDMDDARQQIKALGEQLSVASLRGEDLAVQQARLQLGEYVDPAQIKMVEDLARALYRANNSLSMLTQVDPLANEEARYQQELDNLRALNEAKILEDQRYLDLKAQAEKRYMENMRQLQEQNFRAQNEWNEILMATLDHVQQASTDAITGLLSGINNTREAMQMLAKAILREVVGAFVEMGISQVKAWVMGQAAQTAAGAAYAAAVSGQVAANTALAAQAAYASTAAIPVVGPFLAPAAAVRAGGEAASIGAPAISAAALSSAGGRQYGGPVAAGSMYRVNENGRPEVFKASNGQQFMIPNSRGEVISNSDATGGGAGTVVNLNIVESQDRGGEVERMDGPNGDVTITAFVADIRRDGPASRALSQTFGLKRRGK